MGQLAQGAVKADSSAAAGQEDFGAVLNDLKSQLETASSALGKNSSMTETGETGAPKEGKTGQPADGAFYSLLAGLLSGLNSLQSAQGDIASGALTGGQAIDMPALKKALQDLTVALKDMQDGIALPQNDLAQVKAGLAELAKEIPGLQKEIQALADVYSTGKNSAAADSSFPGITQTASGAGDRSDIPAAVETPRGVKAAAPQTGGSIASASRQGQRGDVTAAAATAGVKDNVSPANGTKTPSAQASQQDARQAVTPDLINAVKAGAQVFSDTQTASRAQTPGTQVSNVQTSGIQEDIQNFVQAQAQSIQPGAQMSQTGDAKAGMGQSVKGDTRKDAEAVPGDAPVNGNAIFSAGNNAPAGSRADEAAMPVKVAQVNDHTVLITKQDGKTIQVSLEPAGLGKLEIQVVLDKGHVNAQIHAFEPAGREVIERNVSNIMNSLASEGINIGSFSVSLGNRGQDGQKAGFSTGRQEDVQEINAGEKISAGAAAGSGILSIFA